MKRQKVKKEFDDDDGAFWLPTDNPDKSNENDSYIEEENDS